MTDFSEGSLNDALIGAFATILNEQSSKIVEEFSKTFFGLAEADDLENLAIDQYGSSFSRPDAEKATVDKIVEMDDYDLPYALTYVLVFLMLCQS